MSLGANQKMKEISQFKYLNFGGPYQEMGGDCGLHICKFDFKDMADQPGVGEV